MYKGIRKIFVLFFVMSLLFFAGCSKDETTSNDDKTVPHEERFGIYMLDLVTEDVEFLYSSTKKLSSLILNNSETKFAFSMKIEGDTDQDEEICILDLDKRNFQRLTTNNFMDIYPAWSPDDSTIAFLSWREDDLDIYKMKADGENQELIYDSGSHDADIDWVGDKIVYTQDSQIWSINSDGSESVQITDPENAGVWGDAILPFGDYDPRLDQDGSKIAFERLVDDVSPHGNYDIFVIDIQGTNEINLTNNGYTQGFANWSHAGDKIVFLVTAIGAEGQYRLYMMNSDGTDYRDITPAYFPDIFLCHAPVFSNDDSKLYFLGEWWE